MVERDALCMSTMQAVERDETCWWWMDTSAGRGKGVHPHLHNKDGGKGYTLISKLQAVEALANFRRWRERLPVPPPAVGADGCPLHIHIADSRQGYTLASIQLTVERHTPSSLYCWQ
jgi:hypothetical protein